MENIEPSEQIGNFLRRTQDVAKNSDNRIRCRFTFLIRLQKGGKSCAKSPRGAGKRT